MFDYRLERLNEHNRAQFAARILYQLEYAHEISQVAGGTHDALIDRTIDYLVQSSSAEGIITQEAAKQAEVMISDLSLEAKRYTVLCVAHAHIDMNWMWRWDETVAVTLDTFRTMLDLMNEYPEFRFSQSQASVYQIVERYAPEMLDEIRQRVEEGRWEVAASTWVEADKNMPNGESHARHLLYTRRYLSRLLGLKPENFQLDYEPDTFGHNANVPEILASGGVKYYYHCRGDQTHLLYRWKAPSGRSILVYREPTWYLGYIDPGMALYAPSFCHKYGTEAMMKVYGVGDHGGGPTRRDIERLLDMDSWPVFPSIRFGTYAEFFAQVEKAADRLPELTGELNFVFTGCYTSQSRIKRANRLAETALNSAETFASFAALDGAHYPGLAFAEAWQNTLFNQFHDIIPGSGVIDTREYALGLFQQTLATASSAKRRAYQSLLPAFQAGKDNRSGESGSIAEGAGVGFGVEGFRLSQVSRSGGLKRLFHVFNPSPWPRRQVVELVVWDWQGDLRRLVVLDEQGRSVPHQSLDRGWNDYWGHQYLRLLVQVSAPACGYTSLILTESEAVLESKKFPVDSRTEQPITLVLENEHLRAEFNRQSCALVSLVERVSNKELIDPQAGAGFRRILEDDGQGMTAWVVGRYMGVQDWSEGARLLKFEHSGEVRQWLTYEVTSGASRLTVTVSLDADSRRLEYAVECDWQEVGRRGQGVPQLNFHLPLGYACQAYRYDIPFGTVDRKPSPMDVPANSWGMALPVETGHPKILLVNEGSYGFRGDEDSLALTLIRSSYDPDPYPEQGIHKISFSLHVLDGQIENQELAAAAFDITHPLDVISSAGTAPSSASFMEMESGTGLVSAVKSPEDGSGLIVRLHETDGQETEISLRFAREISRAEWVDTHEEIITGASALHVEGKRIRFRLAPHSLGAIRVQF